MRCRDELIGQISDDDLRVAATDAFVDADASAQPMQRGTRWLEAARR